MLKYTYNAVEQLTKTGIEYGDAVALRRISMTLRRWYELECGNGNDYGSWAIERNDNGDGPPFMVHHHYMHGRGKDTVSRTKIADKERGAEKRLAAIMAKYPTLGFYLQTDPRGASLYILRPGDIPEGQPAECYYNNGVVVCQ